MEKWAQVVAHFMKPGGSFVFAEFHPVVWMFDNDLKYVQYSYFKAEPILETESGTYADREINTQYSTMTWNHSIGEVFTALKNKDSALRRWKNMIILLTTASPIWSKQGQMNTALPTPINSFLWCMQLRHRKI